MQDQFERNIEYLRISITDRCNLRCSYCMPETGVTWLSHGEILSYEEILRVIRIATTLGFAKFRITGGEPLVRKGIVPFLEQVSSVPGVKDLTLTTNGILLGGMADAIKLAGVNRVNISLDTLKPEKFHEITRGGNLQAVLDGIHKSLEAGLEPVKINMVVMKGFNDAELEDFVRLAENYPLHVRFIELMPVGASDQNRAGLITVDQMKARLGIGNLVPVREFQGAGPAQHFTGGGLKGSIGFISAISQHFCSQCNRIRLTADGMLKPCLHSRTDFDLRSLLRGGASEEEIKQAMQNVVYEKPSRHNMTLEGWEGRTRVMSQIGG
ncbi:MAG TPA: GTP 3',8-cyclase MoaA [Verrucomicrobiae bacterium]|nr:GTP 3',8-cyclase MoaA [Verrucomicrobiae bacterium]